MKVALDASFIALNQASGVRTYTLMLLQGLLQCAPEDEYLCYYNVFRGGAPLPAFPPARNCNVRVPRRLLEWCWSRAKFPAVDWFTGPVDVFHSVHLLVPPQRRGRSILTVHDFRECRYPELYPQLQPKRALRARMAQRADHIIAVSHATKQDAVEFLQVEPEKISVIHNGLEPRFFTPPSPAVAAAVRSRWSLDQPYVLFVSSADARKGLADGLSIFRRALPSLSGYRLVVAGSLPRNGEQWIRDSGLGGAIVCTGIVTDDEMAGLLRGSQALLFPSYYEGFGFPLLEGFASEVPVLCYRISSMPEVAGDAALMVEFGDIDGLAQHLVAACQDVDLRRRLLHAGLERARLFSWSRAAEQVHAVYKAVAST